MSFTLPRIIAVILAAIGTIWAVFLVLISVGLAAPLLLGFAMGFVVWIGWVIRASPLVLNVTARRGIWFGSVGYNGFWVYRMLESPAHESIVLTGWWAVAALLSLIALLGERRLPNPEGSVERSRHRILDEQARHE